MTDTTADTGGLTLYVARHAEANMRGKDEQDDERTLSASGESCAQKIAGILQAQMPRPTWVIASPAMRTRQTATFLTNGFEYSAEAIHFVPEVYNAALETLLQVLAEIDAQHSSVMLVGHNPGVSELVSHFSVEPVGPLGTCNVYQLHFPDTRAWSELQAHSASTKEIA